MLLVRHRSIGCITLKDRLAGRRAEIHAERDRKQEETGKRRQVRPRGGPRGYVYGLVLGFGSPRIESQSQEPREACGSNPENPAYSPFEPEKWGQSCLQAQKPRPLEATVQHVDLLCLWHATQRDYTPL